MDRFINYINKMGSRLYRQLQRKTINFRLEEDECKSLAAIGLRKAMKTYNPNKGKKLEAYAYNYIKHEVQQAVGSHFKQNKQERSLEEHEFFIPCPAKRKNVFMCFDILLKIFSHKLTKDEKIILEYHFCDGLTPYKIAKKMGIKLPWANGFLRSAIKKLELEISKYGDIRNKDDIRKNLAMAQAQYYADKFSEDPEYDIYKQELRIREI